MMHKETQHHIEVQDRHIPNKLTNNYSNPNSHEQSGVNLLSHSLKIAKLPQEKEKLSKRYRDEAVLLNLNAIILQHLEVSGLDETYKTFYDESQMVGFPVPESYPAEPSSSSGICHSDVEILLEYFESENGKDLLKLWESMMHEANALNSLETSKITVYIHVYIALIPYRKNLSEDEKLQSMQELRDYFQTKANECTTDEEVLSFFALPFVQDPKSHPIFSRLLTELWTDQVRCRLRSLGLALCSQKITMNPLETDLAQLFLSWSNGVEQIVKTNDGKTWKLHSTLFPVTLSSGASNETLFDKDAPIKLLVGEIKNMDSENKILKEDVKALKKKLSDQIALSTALTEYITGACSSKPSDITKLKNITSDVFCIAKNSKSNSNIISKECVYKSKVINSGRSQSKLKSNETVKAFKKIDESQYDSIRRNSPNYHHHQLKSPKSQRIQTRQCPISSDQTGSIEPKSNRSNSSSRRIEMKKVENGQPNKKIDGVTHKNSSRHPLPLIISSTKTDKIETERSKSNMRSCITIDKNHNVSIKDKSLPIKEFPKQTCFAEISDEDIEKVVSRPQTYHVHSPKSGSRSARLIASSEKNCYLLSARPGTVNLPQTSVIYSSTFNPTSPGKRTYRVRCIDTNAKSIYIPQDLNVENKPLASFTNNTAINDKDKINDLNSNKDKSISMCLCPMSPIKSYKSSNLSPQKDCSARARGDFSRTDSQKLQQQKPLIIKANATSTPQPSWHTSSHTADNIEIKAIKLTRTSKRSDRKGANVTEDKPKIRRSVSLTNIITRRRRL